MLRRCHQELHITSRCVFSSRACESPSLTRNLLHPLGVGELLPALVLHRLPSDLALFTALSSLKEPQNKTNLMGASLWQTSVLLSHLQNHTCYLQANKLLQSSDLIPHHAKSCFHFSRLSLFPAFTWVVSFLSQVVAVWCLPGMGEEDFYLSEGSWSQGLQSLQKCSKHLQPVWFLTH